MTSSHFRRMLAAAMLATLAGGAIAQTQAEARPTPRALEQRLHEEVQAVLLRLVESGELRAEDAADLSLMAPVSLQVDLGAILDVRYRADADVGLPVLGVTPGGSAAALGLQPGDRVLAVNTVALAGLGADADGRARAAQRLREELLAAPDAIELRVARGDAEQVLRGPVRVVELPAYRLELGAALAHASLAATAAGDGVSRCGRVSVFDIAPRLQQLHRAVLIAVDGHLPGPSDATSYRLTSGRHVLTVAEAIDARRFTLVQGVQRSRLGDERYKKLEIDVQPGITYRLAARFHREARGNVRTGEYWDPVIWKETPETCR